MNRRTSRRAHPSKEPKAFGWVVLIVVLLLYVCTWFPGEHVYRYGGYGVAALSALVLIVELKTGVGLDGRFKATVKRGERPRLYWWNILVALVALVLALCVAQVLAFRM